MGSPNIISNMVLMHLRDGVFFVYLCYAVELSTSTSDHKVDQLDISSSNSSEPNG